MGLIDELTNRLPTPATRLVAAATVGQAPFSFAVPHFLSPLWPKSTQVEIVLAQILLPTLLGLIGSLTLLVLVLRRRNRYADARLPVPTVAAKTYEPDAFQVELLKLLASDVRTYSTDEVSKYTGKSRVFSQHSLEQLQRQRMVSGLQGYGHGLWRIEFAGTDYLKQKGLLR